MSEPLSAKLPLAIERRIGKLLLTACAKELRLATAESCTGGLIASLLTDVDGCAHAFECGFVTYSDAAKIKMLGINRALLKQHGAVSEAVARVMAERALARSAADVAFAVTGYAGPTEDGEEGLVHFACARRNGSTRHRESHFGTIGRGKVRLGCVKAAVEMLEEALA